MSGTTFNWVGGTDTDWTTASNWDAGTVPNGGTDVALDLGGPEIQIPNATTITVGSLTIGPDGRLVLGQHNPGTAALVSLGPVSVASTNPDGGVVGVDDATVTAPTLTIAPGTIIGGGGTYTVADLVNDGTIQADGGFFGLGAVVVNGGVLSGSGIIEVDHTSTFELGSATSQTIVVKVDPTETATIILDDPGSFTGSIAIANPGSHLDLVLVPTDGIATTDFSSADLGALLDQGARLSFINGTEAVQLTDSKLSVGPDSNEATIQRLYEGLLGRSGDTAGISAWDTLLAAGVSKATIATDFLNSDEYLAVHGAETDEQFITSLYQGLLGRAPEPEGLAGWSGLLAQGVSRGDVAIGIADSPEAKSNLASTTAQIYVPDPAGTLAHELYKTGLGREVDLGALSDFKAAFAVLTPSQLAAGVAGLPEFAATHDGEDNAGYVSSLYQAGLGRAPEPLGLAGWTGLLDSGAATRSDVLFDIATSSEATAHLTRDLNA